MQLRKKLAVGATFLSLGGLTGVAMSAGAGRKREQSPVPLADVRTVTEQQTIRRYRHIGAGGSSTGSAGGVIGAVGHSAGVAVRTRVSGSKVKANATGYLGSTAVKSGPSGAHAAPGARHTATSSHGSGAQGTSPTTRLSGSKTHTTSSAGTAPATGNPTTKPSGSTGETTSAPTSTTPPPTTKPSGAPPSGGSGGGTTGTGTTPTPPPTTKPSGSKEGSETSGGSGGGGTQTGGEHEEDGHGGDN